MSLEIMNSRMAAGTDCDHQVQVLNSNPMVDADVMITATDPTSVLIPLDYLFAVTPPPWQYD